MNAAILIMSSAALAGADPAPPPPPSAAPIVVSSGAGCNNCAPVSCCDSGRVGILDRVRARIGGLGRKSKDCSCPPPVYCPPPPTCQPCPTSYQDRPNLLDKMREWWGKRRACAAACCDPCAGVAVSPATPAPGGGTTPPKEMPKPKDEGKKEGSEVAIPAPPVVATSPY